MKRRRHSVEVIVAAVKQHELGMPITKVARNVGVAEATFFREGRSMAVLNRMKSKIGSNSATKAASSSGSWRTQTWIRPCSRTWCKRVVGAPQRRAAVRNPSGHYGISERRACPSVRLNCSVFRYRSRRPGQEPLRRRIRDIALARLPYGCDRVYVLLCRAGLLINQKHINRLDYEKVHNCGPSGPTAREWADAATSVRSITMPKSSLEHGLCDRSDSQRPGLAGANQGRAIHARMPGRRARPEAERDRGRPTRVHCDHESESTRPPIGPMGASDKGHHGVLAAWQAHGQYPRRVLQSQLSGQIPEHPLV